MRMSLVLVGSCRRFVAFAVLELWLLVLLPNLLAMSLDNSHPLSRLLIQRVLHTLLGVFAGDISPR